MSSTSLRVPRLALVAAVLLSAACGSDETAPPTPDAPMIPEDKLAGVTAFPDPGGLVRTVESIPLEPSGTPTEKPGVVPEKVAVASISPVGPDGAPTSVEIGFNQPMKTFDGAQPLADDGPIVLTPGGSGRLSWVNDSTLSFRPDAPFPVATRIKVAVPTDRGLVSATGAPLAEPSERELETTRLEVTWAPYSYWDYPASREPEGTIPVELNQPVALKDVERVVRVLRADSKDALKAGRGKAIAFVARALPREEGQPQRNGFEIVPEGGFAIGAWYHITVPTTLHGPGPLGLSEPREIIARGPERLRVSYASCGYDTCTPSSEWSVSFVNNLVPESLEGCFSLSSGQVEGLAVEGSYVTFRAAGLRAGTKARLTVGTSCRDVLGTQLATPYTLDVDVQEPPARLRMSEGSGYLEPAPVGEPVALELGAEATGKLQIRRLRFTADTLPALLSTALDEYGGLALGGVEGGATTTLAGPKPSDSDGLRQVPIAIDDVLGEGNRGVVFVEVTAERKGSYGEPPVRRALVQVTDTGITVKTSAQDTLVWTTSLATGAPVGGVRVSLLDAQGKTLWSGETDASGLAKAPSQADLGAKVRIAIARGAGDDLAFVDLEDWTTRIDPYRFDLPYAWEPQANVVRGFVFTERGVYRAGEKVYVKGYLRRDRGKTLELPEERQATVEVTDPMGETAFTSEVSLDALGGFDVAFDLDQGAALGGWSIGARLAGADDADQAGGGRGSFRVEAYRPNRFEVKVADSQRAGDAVTATVTGRYLYGAPMNGAKVRWWATRVGDAFAPAGFSEYAFAKASDRWWWEPDERSSATLGQGEGVLDADGSFTISAALGELDFSDGPLGVVVEAEVTDVDEQVVAGRDRLRLDPGAFYVGVSRSASLAEADKPFEASVVAVAPDGTQLEGKAIRVSLKKRTWESVKKAAAGGGTTWVSEVKDTVVTSADLVSVARGPAKTTFTAPGPGTYLVEATAEDGAGHTVLSSQELWVWGSGDGWWARADDERLTVVAEKDGYAVGDVARFLVQSPFESAHALVTVERQGVIWQKAVAIEGGAPLIEVPITEAMQPNAFVSFTLVRGRVEAAAADPDKGRPAAKVGYAKISVDLGDKTLKVAVTPQKASYRPGDTVKTTLALQDAAGRPSAGRVTFYAVDEGVLQLTGYRTPNGLATFYAPQPLSVSTVESRRRLWARIDPTDDGMKSDWGGGGDEEAATSYRSAFATTAVFLPSVEVGADGQAEVAFTLPDNLGAFRLMAVAAAEGNRFGRADTRIEVNKPILVRPGLPRFVSSGDTFEARAVVQALQETGSGEVVVELAASGPVEILEASSVSATLSRNKAETITFKARAKAPGAATFAFKVTPAGATEAADAVKVEIPVAFPASVRSAIESGLVTSEHGVEGLAARRVEVPDWVRDDVGGVDVEIASSQLGELLPGLHYLVHYPYGCVEQTTGATLPLLALSTMSEDFSLPGIDHAQVLARAQAGVDRLRTMQLYNGGLSYWPGGDEPHPWGSAYGGLALVRASKVAGVQVPQAALDGVKTFLHSVLAGQHKPSQSEWAAEMHPVEPFAAYVLALAGDPDAGSMSRLFEQRATLPAFGKALLAMALAEADGDAGMVKTLTDELLADVRVDADRAMLDRKDSTYYWSTMDSDVRSTALVMLALMRTRPDDAMIPKLARGLLGERRHGRWISTQENAFAILALGEFFEKTEKPGRSYLATVRLDGEILLSERMQSASLAPRRVRIPMSALRAAGGKLLTVTREGDDAPLYYTLTFDYAPKDIPKIPIQRGFDLQREYVMASGPRAGEKVTQLKSGDLVEVRLKVSTPARRRYVALDDPLPAGLEPVNTGFDTTGSRGAGGLTSSWIFNHSEQQDDRVAIFANDMPAGTFQHSYLARATTTGAFIAPAARVHEMYHPDVFGQAAALDLTVE